MNIDIEELAKEFGTERALHPVSLSIPSGALIALLGPSGSGKTTLLRILAGLEFPTSGRVRLGGQDATGLTVQERRAGFVFQHYALFKHMTVLDNIGFGLSVRPRGSRPAKREIESRAKELLDLVQLSGLEKRYPAQLSGGQRQRVALARCLVLEPTLLLLDEPLGALDLKLREQMKVELKHLQKQFGTTFVYITHDQSEAMVMSDQVAVMKNGRFEQVAPPEELYRHPATPFVAGFVGDNNRLAGTVVSVADDVAAVRLSDGAVVRGRAASAGLAPGAQAELYIRPESLSFSQTAAVAGSSSLQTRVRTTLFDGANSRVEVESNGQALFARLPQDGSAPALTQDGHLELSWDPDLARVFGAAHQ